MDSAAFVALNGPLSFAANLVNALFCFCLCYPGEQSETLKQPLKLLFISVVTSNVCLQATIFLYTFVVFFPTAVGLRPAVVFVASCISYTNMLTCMWLSIFYYTRIVPPRRAFFIWIKRNIEAIVYCGLIVNSFFILVQGAGNSPWVFSEMTVSVNGTSSNPASGVRTSSALVSILRVSGVLYICSFTLMVALSWGATLAYLCRHMKRMELSSGRSSSSRLRSQLRVTVMGCVQTALSVSFLSLTFLHWYYLYKCDSQGYGVVTICSLFSTATAVNLGLGQSVLRRRVADVFSKVR